MTASRLAFLTGLGAFSLGFLLLGGQRRRLGVPGGGPSLVGLLAVGDRLPKGVVGLVVADGLDVGEGHGEEVVLGLPGDGAVLDRVVEEVEEGRGDLGL